MFPIDPPVGLAECNRFKTSCTLSSLALPSLGVRVKAGSFPSEMYVATADSLGQVSPRYPYPLALPIAFSLSPTRPRSPVLDSPSRLFLVNNVARLAV